ncbi:hypothetical protein, variant 1 [Blastomyces gilchristii SLH14081]|uniref:Mg2+ transporter protein, CorA-like/Zinc transport protein ZntB n=2 Tax=Blastomyces TaxID=229219 RepID=A0A179V165_BLAGS|nr:uncharacterized protein BDBG_08452 [Blastomyces gilchristii SLH14081]XP_031580753.1 hypothetical protein, variant 1 [Blastomyces gilchristii SLH14081]EGE83186.2 hypothetical protein BDDG_06130 [Blastomyces dermatitidis ATCC 18188]EQL29549.1 hypothetical protein BDFG_07854 [Blastomyces dermatitidis ATCC 26199]OAT13198.1 hypothetical protein BDBG_08452 [Blastomyces gilchristii SLH14081]OAT13199.1 hypothetical protein, variant 1 [Blastomyces gilchristii SLH14081]
MLVDVTEKIGDVISRRQQSTLEEELRQQPSNSVRIAFAGMKKDCEKWIANNPNAITKLPIPHQFWATCTEDLNGCSNAIYSHGGYGELVNLDTWSCFKLKEASSDKKYVWYQMTMFIRWNPIKQTTFIFCSDFLQCLRDGLNRRISSVGPSDPFTWHASFVDELRLLYDNFFWKFRNLVRDAEKERNEPQATGPNFPRLHDIARHVIHSVEILDVAIETVDSILHEHDLFISNEGSTVAFPIPDLKANDVTRRLYYHSRELRAIKARSASLYDRLKNEISLSFNLVSQTDTAAMKIISAVGLIFLPGTFISTLFGMNFFDFSVDEDTGKQTFAMSDKFWVYWAISLPVTAAVLLAWVLYDYSYLITSKIKKPLLEDSKFKEILKLGSFFRRKEKQSDANSPT